MSLASRHTYIEATLGKGGRRRGGHISRGHILGNKEKYMGRRVGDRYMSKIRREYFREEKKGLLLVERIRGASVS